MTFTVRRAPHVLTVLSLAFAPTERVPLLAVAELFRGFAIQLAYRWPVRQVMIDDDGRAALLWSVPVGPPERARRAAGVGAAVIVGLALFVASNVLLLLPVRATLHAAGASANTLANVQFSILSVRLLFTFCRAVGAFVNDARLRDCFPPAAGRRLRVDHLAAIPARRGHGGRLLDEFLVYADSIDADVVLNADSSNVSFYRAHGFLVVHTTVNGHRLMLRERGSARYAPSRAARRAHKHH